MLNIVSGPHCNNIKVTVISCQEATFMNKLNSLCGGILCMSNHTNDVVLNTLYRLLCTTSRWYSSTVHVCNHHDHRLNTITPLFKDTYLTGASEQHFFEIYGSMHRCRVNVVVQGDLFKN